MNCYDERDPTVSYSQARIPGCVQKMFLPYIFFALGKQKIILTFWGEQYFPIPASETRLILNGDETKTFEISMSKLVICLVSQFLKEILVSFYLIYKMCGHDIRQ